MTKRLLRKHNIRDRGFGFYAVAWTRREGVAEEWHVYAGQLRGQALITYLLAERARIEAREEPQRGPWWRSLNDEEQETYHGTDNEKTHARALACCI